MGFVKQTIERKLSERLGTRVTIERMNFSLLGGSLDVGNVTVFGTSETSPVLTIRRVKAGVAMGAILRKEVSIKSVVIEGIFLTIVRAPDGSTNLPKRGDGPSVTSTAAKPDAPDEDTPSAWNLAAAKVQLLHGAVHFRDGAYHASAERIVGEMLQKPDGIHFTLLAASVGRRDSPLEIGEARANGVLSGVDSIARLLSAKLDATFDIADIVRGSVSAPELARREFNGAVHVKGMLALLRKLLPARLLPPLWIDGTVELSATGSYDPQSGLRGAELNFRAMDVTSRRN